MAEGRAYASERLPIDIQPCSADLSNSNHDRRSHGGTGEAAAGFAAPPSAGEAFQAGASATAAATARAATLIGMGLGVSVVAIL